MKVGFIGCGNMAQAMINGIVKAELVSADNIIASDAFQPSLDKARNEIGIQTTMDNKEVASTADMIVLAVKPQFYETVIEEIKDEISSDAIIVTIAPGQSLEKLSGLLGSDVKIVRTMPNTPAMVGEGMTALCANDLVSEDEKAAVKRILEGFGKAEYVPEYMMDAVVSVSGSSPAYIFILIEALADGAVLLGMGRQEAYKFAAQSVLGSAKMVLETGKHPADLKDMVCSPAGTTIEAVSVLEESGFRSSIIEAMIKCADRAKNM